MASQNKGKLIYMIEPGAKRYARVSFRVTQLMKWEHFREAPADHFMQLTGSKMKEFLAPEDQRILLRMAPYALRDEPVAELAGPDGFELLKQIVESGRGFMARGNQLRAKWGEAIPGRPDWNGEDAESFRTAIALNGTKPDGILGTSPPVYVVREGKFDVLGPISTDWPDAAAGTWVAQASMDAEGVSRFVSRFINQYSSVKPPSPVGNNADKEVLEIKPVPRLRVLRRDDAGPETDNTLLNLNDLLLIRLDFEYGNRYVPWHEDREQIASTQDGQVLRYKRNFAFEKEVLETLKSLGFIEKPGGGMDLFDFHAHDLQLPRGAQNGWAYLYKTVFPSLRKKRWRIEYDTNLNLISAEAKSWYQRFRKEKQDWFSFDAGIRYKNQNFSVLPLMRDFLASYRNEDEATLRYRLEESSFAIRVDQQGRLMFVPGSRLVALFDRIFELRTAELFHGRLMTSRWRAGEISADLDVDVEKGGTVDAENFRQLKDRAGSEISLELEDPIPPQLNALRDYQKQGVAWLSFLHDYGFSGILADDMGLGKTFQTLAHLHRLYETGSLSGPSLVIAPTSVLDNWLLETKERGLTLNAMRHHGTQRLEQLNALQPGDVVVTTYGMLRSNPDVFSECDWDYLILDEAQTVKNPASLTARLVRKISAQHKLCLTGTPMENHLGELWALYDFLMPGFLGNRKGFQKQFREPIEGNDPKVSQETSKLLGKRIHPFLLRRKKEDVARELPSKTEIPLRMELTRKQADAYEAARIRVSKEIRTLLEERGIEQSQLHVFEALNELRLLCCDPRLRDNGKESLEMQDSAKLSRLMELLEELIEENRRILVFSQYVRMLNLIEQELRERGWEYELLTGQTRNRAEVVERFQQGKVPIFLISLKAGGTGLNLTAADTVIHYDPWWNPAVQDQASDRIYRIGQDQPVFIYNLITKGTIEEKMIALQDSKKGMIDQLFSGMDKNRMVLDEQLIHDLLDSGADFVTK